MGEVVVELISQFGVLGLVLAGIIYLIVDGIKTKKKEKEQSIIVTKTLSDDIKSHVDDKIGVVNERINVIDQKVDNTRREFDRRMRLCSESISNVVCNKLEQKKSEDDDKHTTAAFNQFEVAPKIHRILKLYRDRVGCDHIFLGVFHNGSTSINGIPFCKFDIVAEKFKPGHRDDYREYTTVYKDTDIVIHDNLPVVISQEDYIYFKIAPDGTSELEEIDDALYRRCVKYGIKQIAGNLIRDERMIPIGFVGCTDYDEDSVLNLPELGNCAKELEELYKINGNKR